MFVQGSFLIAYSNTAASEVDIAVLLLSARE